MAAAAAASSVGSAAFGCECREIPLSQHAARIKALLAAGTHILVPISDFKGSAQDILGKAVQNIEASEIAKTILIAKDILTHQGPFKVYSHYSARGHGLSKCQTLADAVEALPDLMRAIVPNAQTAVHYNQIELDN